MSVICRAIRLPLLLSAAAGLSLHFIPAASAQDALLGIPKGAVVAFRLSACPSGWEPAADLAGRAVFGAGVGQLDQNGKPLSARALGQTGGEETHILSADELPAHSHTVQGYTGTDRGNPGGRADVLFNAINTRTGTEGKNQPHNTMPPYLILTYCEKK